MAAANATALFDDNRDWSNPQDTATITSSRNAAGAVEAAAFRGTFVRSADPLENRPNPYADPQITNRAILPYDRVELGALPGNYRWERGRKLNVTIDQHLAEGFDLSRQFSARGLPAETTIQPHRPAAAGLDRCERQTPRRPHQSEFPPPRTFSAANSVTTITRPPTIFSCRPTTISISPRKPHGSAGSAFTASLHSTPAPRATA